MIIARKLSVLMAMATHGHGWWDLTCPDLSCSVLGSFLPVSSARRRKGSLSAAMAEEKEQSAGMFALMVTLKIVGVLIALYFFLFGLDLMGGSFSALGSKGAGNLFTFSDNPIAGLMVGILATVLVQSSSTSTSIVVGLVGADVLAVRYAIPIIMGANIGTSVTNTIVTWLASGRCRDGSQRSQMHTVKHHKCPLTLRDCFNQLHGFRVFL